MELLKIHSNMNDMQPSSAVFILWPRDCSRKESSLMGLDWLVVRSPLTATSR